MPASAYVPVTGHEANYDGYVQLRYNYRLYPSPGRYCASFVVQTGPAADAARFPAPDTGAEVGIDLGLTTVAVLSDGTVVRSPRFLRRAERKLRRLHKSLSRKAAGSSNKEEGAGQGGPRPREGG